MSVQLQNDRFIKSLLRQPVDKTPVWMMRQAGRYLPEYRASRKKAGSFMDLCTNPDYACEVTLQPLERYDLDAAILFSDILTIPDAMGLGLYFAEGEGPKFNNPISTEADVKNLAVPDPSDKLHYVLDAVSLIRKELKGKVPLIGFSGSPWTLATYMVEGSSTKEFGKVKGMMYKQPKIMHQLLDTLAQSVTSYLNAQIESGAQAVMIFDTWGGVLTPRDYQEFSLRYMQQIVNQITLEKDGQRIPVILFSKGAAQWLSSMAKTGCDALGVDWTINLADARAQVQDQVALQGNMDPCVLYSTPERIQQEVKSILASYGEVKSGGHVFNLGHGIHQHIDPQLVKVFIDSVHEYSSPYHQ